LRLPPSVAKRRAHAERPDVKETPTSLRGAASLAAVAAAYGLGGGPGLAAAVLCFGLTAAAMPLFRRYAMARPNARSSHRTPIPQGGGAAVVAATIALAAAPMLRDGASDPTRLAWIAAAALLLAAVGAADDILNLPVIPRLGLQFAAVAAAVLAAGGEGRILPPLPAPLEVALLVLAGVWFVNLANFMDGIDGITLAGFLPLAGGAAALSWTGNVSPGGGLLAVAFFGALAGFVWFNLPRASLFLGDVGSLPIGLIGGALLLDMAQHGAFAAALILPMYHVLDATSTLLGRLLRRERVWEAHRGHAYQRAVDAGWSHAGVSGLVLLLNGWLAGLAIASTGFGPSGQAAAAAFAALAAGGLILFFRSRGRPA
jgi:UDP-N-acetylmuramyl pentapeptide phosphotransferase/UDP-N-acetylglucosamine-1-phosphate transferase